MNTETATVKHTPGAWQLTTVPFELRSTDSSASIYGPMSKEGGACLIADISRSAGDDEATANAKLIAAAPELLEALDALLTEVSPAFNFDLKNANNEAVQKALAVVKKATQ